MFLKHRALQAEYFDELDRPAAEIAESFAMLARVNRFFAVARTFQNGLPKMLGEERCRSLSLLDLGAGDGSLGKELSRWAATHGWEWRFTNLELNPHAAKLNPNAEWVIGSVLQLPFSDRSFDVVIASQMTHHLTSNDDVCQHFKEAWRVTRDVLFINDLHRNAALYSLLWVWLRVFQVPGHFRSDTLLSVKRGWRVREWQSLAQRAGIPNAHVWLYGGARLVLEARRQEKAPTSKPQAPENHQYPSTNDAR